MLDTIGVYHFNIALKIEDMSVTIKINSPSVVYSRDYIHAKYQYQTTRVTGKEDEGLILSPITTEYTFRTERRIPRLGLMLVGWGGNNGSTVTAAILANKHRLTWHRKDGLQQSNYYGSITQSSTVCLGTGPQGEVYAPMRNLLPMVNPDDIVIDGR